MRVKEVWSADIYRDGGSYGFCLDSDDGHWYEFFLQIKEMDGVNRSYHMPVIYLEGCNSHKIVERLGWVQALEIVKSLEYKNPRFHEIKQIVIKEGCSVS